MRNVIVIAPHPDDETLGCGGTILRHINKGDCVTWVIVTCATEEIGYSKEKIKIREKEIDKVAKMYGFKNTYKLNFTTTDLENIDKREIIKKVSKCIDETNAEIMYVPNWSDVHSDHKIVSEVAISCSKWFRHPTIKEVYFYETLSETEFGINNSVNRFNPNVYININEYIDKKIEIMNVYESEMGEFPFPRSNEAIKALAMVRGATVGVEYAEAFMLLKKIID